MARLVVAKHRLPYPAVTGTDVVTFNLLRALASRHDVTLVSLIVSESQREYAAAFERIGVRLVPVMMPNKKNSFARAWYKLFYTAASWLSASPRDLWYFNPPAFRRAVREAAAGADLLQCEYWFLYPTAGAARGVKKVLLKHDAEFNANRRLLATIKNPFKKLPLFVRYLRRRGYEQAACRKFDYVLCLSPADAELVAPYTRRPPRVVFPVVDLPPSDELCRGRGGAALIYFGGTARPANRQGLEVFLRDIYPRVKAAVPEATFTIRGERPPGGLRRLMAREPSVKLEPASPDLGAALARAAVAVVPLWVGSGIKIKILTALAHGLPVVTTPVGAEGIPARDGAEIVVAEGAREFADAVAELLTDDERWAELSAGGRRFAEREVSPPARDAGIAELYDELARD
jgi:glycosyltransferase involved in cell wall biosynthesis